MNKYAGFIYEWTNKINNKKYLGAHTGTTDDGYVGGGVSFRRDLKKYGLMNFERKVIEYIEDEQKIKDRENYYLDLVDAVDNPDYYNRTNKSSGLRKRKKPVQPKRKTCSTCNQHLCAINYTDAHNIIHYRSKCTICIAKGKKIKPPEPRWRTAGYKKKLACDRCGFRSRYASQLLVYHVDGRLTNTELSNLRTVCLNCVEEVRRLAVPWKPGDLQADH